MTGRKTGRSAADPNERLRRLDWRFLLPDPWPDRVVCFGDARLCSDLEGVGLARSSEARTVALAAAVDPSPAVLAEAFLRLEPGGTCYAEWYSRRGFLVRRARRQLARAGFTAVECYWPWPSPRHGGPRVWLPLDDSAAVRGYLASRPVPQTRRGRLRRRLAEAGWRLAWALRALTHVCAIARKPGGPATGGIRRSVEDGLGLGEQPGRTAWVLTAPGAEPISKLIAFVHPEHDPAARLAVKLARVPSAERALEREAANLRSVERARPDLPGVPRALVSVRGSAGLLALGVSAMPGAPLHHVLSPESFPRLAHAVTDWLSALAGRSKRVTPDEWRKRLVEPALETPAGAPVHLGAAAEPELGAARAALSTLPPLPLVPEQRDCSPWNVLVDRDGALSVVDWESAEPEGLPGLDLWYFLAYSCFFLDGAMKSGRFLDSYRRTRAAETPTGAVAADCMLRYATALGIEPEAFAALRLLTWLVHLRSEAGRKAGESETTSLASLDESLFLTLVREELRSDGSFPSSRL